MWNLLSNTITLYLVFSFMGLGPACLAFPSSRFIISVTAPIWGVVMTTLVGSYLVTANYPIVSWEYAWLVLGMIISSLCLFYRHFLCRPIACPSNSGTVLYSLGLIMITLLMLAPIAKGGLSFIIFRGNYADALNYITMAGYLYHEPLHWLDHTSLESLIAKHPSYSLALDLFSTTRWSTSMLLAWSAYIVHVSLLPFEASFMVLCNIMTFGMAYVFALRQECKPYLALLIAVAISVGFWSQVIMDLHALSQINALPVLFLLLLLVIEYQRLPTRMTAVLLGLTTASFIMLYFEMAVTLILGMLIYFVLLLYYRRTTIQKIKQQYLRVLWVATAAFLPVIPQMLHIILGQFQFISQVKNHWDNDFFTWFYHEPDIGLWGLSYFSGHFLWALLAAFLSALLVHVIMQESKEKTPSIQWLLSSALLLAILCQWCYLFFIEQRWAACRVMSYAYPFLFLMLLYVFRYERSRKFILWGQYAVVFWLVLQCSLGAMRITVAQTGKEYPHYFGNHPAYRQHDWDLSVIQTTLKKNPVPILALGVEDPWLTEYLALSLGWDVPLINLNNIPDRSQHTFTVPTVRQVPDHWVTQYMDNEYDPSKVIAKNKEFLLLKIA